MAFGIKNKPCEKCGGWPRFKRVGDWKDLFVCECMSCGYIRAKSYEARRSVIGALLVWNR